MLKKLLRKLFKRQDKPKEKYYHVPDALVGLNVPEAGQFLAQRFQELKETCTPLIEYREEESSRAEFIKEGIIEQLEDHTSDTLGNLEDTLKRGLEAIEVERKKLAIWVQPLP